MAAEARNIATIKASIMAQFEAEADLATINNPSKTAIYNLWAYITAVAMFLHETLWTFFRTEIETLAKEAAPGTPAWWQKQILAFQSGDIIQLINLVPTYAVIDPTKQIVTQVSVITDGNKNVQIKVAKSSPPAALTVGEVADLQAYSDAIDFSGVDITIISQAADRLFIDALIIYNGQYAATIQTDVINAINSFLSTFQGVDFNGVIKVSELEEIILDVPGVTDMQFNNLRARDSATPLAGAQYLIQANAQISRTWQTVAGYIIQEDTAGNTFANTLIFQAE